MPRFVPRDSLDFTGPGHSGIATAAVTVVVGMARGKFERNAARNKPREPPHVRTQPRRRAATTVCFSLLRMKATFARVGVGPIARACGARSQQNV